MVPAAANDTVYGRLISWMDAPDLARTISPSSPKTVRAWVAERIAENRLQALEEAAEVQPGDPLVLAAIAELLTKDAPALARFYAAYATSHASVYAEDEDDKPVRPRQAAVFMRAANAWRKIGDEAQARAAADTPASWARP